MFSFVEAGKLNELTDNFVHIASVYAKLSPGASETPHNAGINSLLTRWNLEQDQAHERK